MVCKVSKFINGFTVGIDNVSKAFLGCFSTRNCPEKKDERYQIAESISTESKYFHDFQAIADQFRFLDKTKGTIPKLHCPEEEAERYQESNPCESNYDNGLKTNADQDLSIDLEIKGTNPKLHCPEEEAERYQRSNPCESNYGHGVKNNADQDLSIDLEINGTSPKLHCPEEEAERYQESNPSESNYDHGLKNNADQDLSIDLEIKGSNPKLQCPEAERCEDPEFDLKKKGNSILTLYEYETNKSKEEDAEQLKRKTECKEEMTASKEVETKVKNEGSDEVQNCPVSSSKQEMVITKLLKGENACNEGTGVANQLKGKKEVLNQVKEKIEDNDADETMNYDGKSCPKEMTGEKQIEEKNEQKEVMAKAKEEEDENECNGETNVAKQIKVKEGMKTNTCYDIDNGKMTKVKQIKCITFNEEKSTAEKKDVNVFNTNKNDYAETTKESKGKKENAFEAKQLNVKKDDQVENVRKRNDAQNKKMTLAKHREGKISFDFGQWLKFFSVLAKPFPFLFILVCLAGGAIASGDGYLKTEEVLNASDPFIGPDRCNIESDKLQCNHQEIKACIPDINGSMWVVCTGNFPLTGYACPVVTKTSKDNHWIVQSIDNKCNNCSYSETIKERLHRENNTVGEECLRSYAVYPSKMNATNYEDDGLVLKIIAITISVIVAIIIAIGIGCWCFKYRRGRNNQQNGNNVNPVNKEHNRGDGMELQTLNRGAGSEPLTQNGGAGSEPLTQNGGAGSEHLTQNGGAGSEHLTQNKEEERERLMQNGERGC